MALVNAKQMLLTATAQKYAVGAFNITNIIEMRAVVAAAVKKNSPLIIQTSVTPSKFLSPELVAGVYRILAEEAPIPICLNLDHSNEAEYCFRCTRAGYSSIMIDASKKPFEENIKLTRQVTDFCHEMGGVSVEGELGTVSGVEDQVRVAEDEAELCDPDQVAEFIERTQVDMLAPAIGTAHGVYKTANPKIDLDRLAQISQAVNGKEPKVPLVVHGGTGLKPEVVKGLVAAGGAKFNVSTDLKHALIDSTFEYISSHRDQYDPGKVDKAATEAIMARVEYWIDLLGSEGKA